MTVTYDPSHPAHCHLANGAIEQETGRRPVHPFQVMARAYGLPEEPR